MTLLLYLISIFALSTSPIFTKYSQIPIESLGFYRLFIATFVLLTYTAFQEKLWTPKTATSTASPEKYFPRPWSNPDMYWLLGSGVFFFFHLIFYFYAAHNTSIANTTILYSCNPLISSFLAAVLFKEKLTWKFFISYFIALIGLLLLFQKDVSEATNLWGNLFAIEFKKGEFAAFLAAISFAVYINFSKKARRSYNNKTYAKVKYTTAALLFLIWGSSQGQIIWPVPMQGWIAILGQVLLPTLLGHFLFSYLLKSMDIQLMTCGKLIEPVFSSLLAYYILHESLRPNTWWAFLFMSIALLILFSKSIYNFFYSKMKPANS